MLKEIGARAREAARVLAAAGENQKNAALAAAADGLLARSDEILKANGADLCAARENGARPVMMDRLRLDPGRIAGIAAGIREIIAEKDPVGEELSGLRRPNGLVITKKRVPLGVVGIIYEARPNVTADAAALCLKSGNACILRGGREAISSNLAIAEIFRSALLSVGLPGDGVTLLQDEGREGAAALMKARGVVDVLIPRGGAGLIRAVVENSTVPVIETGTGNCHIYVEKTADPDMARDIVFNAKTQRPSVCNAAETLLIDEDAAAALLPGIAAALAEKNVELRGCARTREILKNARPAAEEDYYEEFLDYILAIRVVDGIEQAMEHIAKYGSGHSEAIVTSDYFAAERFLAGVDSAAVYANASTRFTDGNEFGLGAEIGISTQKLHARGPMGLCALTTTKYIIRGGGQIR